MTRLGKAIKALRRRLDVNMSEFGATLGVSHAAVSQYEAGKVVPGQSVFLLLSRLAEPGELAELLAARGEALPVEAALPKEPNPVTQLRVASGLGRGAFADAIGYPASSLLDLENGTRKPPGPVLDRLKTMAARLGKADLALQLSSEEWMVKAVFHPGERFITTAGKKLVSEGKDKREDLHALLGEVIEGGSSELVDLAEANLKVWAKQARLVAAKKKRV